MTIGSRRSLVFAFLGLAALAGARPMAQQQTPRTVGTPGVDQLTVDFLAVAKDDARTPILDLTKETVTLKVGGKNRVITSLQLLKMEGPAPAAAAASAAAPVASAFPAPFATNVRAVTGGPGRNLLFIIDTETIRSGEEGPVRTAILGLLAKLTTNDQASVVAIPHGGMNVEMTSEIAKVSDAITHFTGAAPASETSTQANDRSRLDVEAVTNILRSMSGSDRPTTIIYVASSLMGAGTGQSINSTNSGRGADAASTISQGELTADTFNKVRENIGAARAQIFVVQAESGPTISGASPGTTNQGLMTLAGLGGGEFYSHISLGSEDAVARVARTTSAYYVATFDADPSDKISTRYPISISSSRADVKFLVRPDFERTKAAANTKAPTIDEMFKTSDAFRDLPMRAVGYSVRPIGPDKDKTTWVRAFAEVLTPGVKLTAASAGIYDFTGRLVFRTAVPAAELAKPLIQASLQAPPGKYKLRFAATDGKVSGAVDYPIEIGLTPAGAFKMSSLMVIPKLQFSTETEAAAIFELYGQNSGQQLSIEFFLVGAGPEPKPLDMKPIQAAPGEADKYIVGVTVPLADLPPGDYQVKAIVGVVGQPSGTVVGTIRKVK
jgi:hypothetical protein